MLDVITRACLNPIDYSGVLNKRKLIFKEKIQESEDIYSFIFEPEKPLSWLAGQHSIFTLPGKKVEGKTWRPFSVASAPHEGVIRIGTIISSEPSDFKKKLLSLKPGEKITMYGPYGEFHRNKNIKQIVGIAGGIGITPFRSLLADLRNTPEDKTKITLIYSAKDSYTYKKEIDDWAQDSRISVIYTHTKEEVEQTISNQTNIYDNQAHYFISGSPGMIGGIRKTLKKKGIRNIVNDPFKGY